MTDKLIIEPPPNDVSVEQQPSRTSDTATDLFSLLYAPEVKQDRVVVPPSRWATFECKNTVSFKNKLLTYLCRMNEVKMHEQSCDIISLKRYSKIFNLFHGNISANSFCTMKCKYFFFLWYI